MATIINFQEYLKLKGKRKNPKKFRSTSSGFGKIIYFNKKEAINNEIHK